MVYFVTVIDIWRDDGWTHQCVVRLPLEHKETFEKLDFKNEPRDIELEVAFINKCHGAGIPITTLELPTLIDTSIIFVF